MLEQPGQAVAEAEAPVLPASRRARPARRLLWRWLVALLVLLLLHQSLAFAFTLAERGAQRAIALTALGHAAPWPPPAFAWLPPAVRRDLDAQHGSAVELSRARRTQLSAALNELAAGARLVAALDARDGVALTSLAADFERSRREREAAQTELAAAPPEPRVDSAWLAAWPSAIASLAARRSTAVPPPPQAAGTELMHKARRATSFRERALDLAAAELSWLEEQYGPIRSAAALASLPLPTDGYGMEKLARSRARLRLAGELAVELAECSAVITAAAAREREAEELSGGRAAP